MERKTGLEPATYSLEGYHSTNWVTSAKNVGREGFEPPKLAQEIYSLPHLATLVPARVDWVDALLV